MTDHYSVEVRLSGYEYSVEVRLSMNCVEVRLSYAIFCRS